MCSDSEAGSHVRPIDSCITQLKVQGPSRTCNKSKEEEGGGTTLTLAEVDGLLPVQEWVHLLQGSGLRVEG